MLLCQLQMHMLHFYFFLSLHTVSLPHRRPQDETGHVSELEEIFQVVFAGRHHPVTIIKMLDL